MEFGEVKDEKLNSYSASENMKWYSHSVQQFSSVLICRATITKNQRLVMYSSLCWICYLQIFFPTLQLVLHPLNRLCCRGFLVFSFLKNTLNNRHLFSYHSRRQESQIKVSVVSAASFFHSRFIEIYFTYNIV